MIFVDTDILFVGVFKNTFQDNLLVPIHAVARANQESIIIERFNIHLNKVQKMNSAEKFIIHQCLKGLFFFLYVFNLVLVDGNDIYQSVVIINI